MWLAFIHTSLSLLRLYLIFVCAASSFDRYVKGTVSWVLVNKGDAVFPAVLHMTSMKEV